jgi:signal transduction histidine kinase/CheY-like chemotaxis protein
VALVGCGVVAQAAPADPATATRLLSRASMTISPSAVAVTNLASLKTLPLAEAGRALPVRIQVAATYCQPGWQLLFVADGTNTAYFECPRNTPAVKPGEVIELEGSSSVVSQAPTMRVQRVIPTGLHQSPVLVPTLIGEIARGDASCRWVELEGEVQSATPASSRLALSVSVQGHNLTAFLLGWQPEDVTRLVKAVVKVRGTISNSQDSAGHFTGASLLIQESKQIEVIQRSETPPGPPANTNPPATLATLSAVLGLPVDQAQQGYRLRITATVTYCHPQWQMLFITADGLGTFLTIARDTPPLRPGDVVEIEGATSAGRGFPDVKADRIRATGETRTLVAKSRNLDEILGGIASSQWVELEGRVLAAYGKEGRTVLQMSVGHTNLPVFLLHAQADIAREWMDAQIRVRDVVSIQYNTRGEATGVAILAQETDQVQVRQPVSSHPLDLPVTPIGRLRERTAGKPSERVNIQGVLDQLRPDLRGRVNDRTGTIRVQCSFKPDVQLDLNVEVLGYPALADGELVLRDAVILPGLTPAGSVGGESAEGTASALAALGLALQDLRPGSPVKERATVTYCHPQWRSLFVAGEKRGVFLNIPTSTIELRPGEVAEIETRLDAVNDTSRLLVERVTATGERRVLPTPNRSVPEILNGSASAQRVEITGGVTAVYGREGRMVLHVDVGNAEVPVYLLHWQLEQARQLLGARVRAQAVLSLQYSGEGRLTGVALLAQEADQVQVTEPGRLEVLDLPALPIGRLAAPRAGKPDSRIHIQGAFERMLADKLMQVRDPSGVSRVECARSYDLPVDSRVDILGSPVWTNGTVTLRNAMLLSLSSLTAPASVGPQTTVSTEPLPLLQTAQEVRQLTAAEAARGYPVRLEGVVTHSDPAWRFAFVQDESDGAFVEPASGRIEVRAGQHVRVEGVTAAGNFVPIVSKATFTVLGETQLPTPLRATLDELLTGQFDCTWVEVRGVVESLVEDNGRFWLYLATSQGRLRALLAPGISWAQAKPFVEAAVTLRGVVSGELNQQGRLVGIRLHVPDLSAIVVDEPAVADSGSVAPVQIADLLRYRRNGSASRRVKVFRRVTSVSSDDMIALQDESGGILLRMTGTRELQLPQLGDQVEVLGLPSVGDFGPTLLAARLRVLGSGGSPDAIVTTPDEILSGKHDAQLVRLQGRLLEDASLVSGQTLMLQSGSVVFHAVLPSVLNTKGTILSAGSTLEVTGVCLIRGGQWGQVKSFHLQLRQRGDLRVLIQPPWWNLRRLAWGAAGLGGAGALALVGILLLAKKNQLLTDEMSERKRAQEQLARARDELEVRVHERTQQLERAKVAAEAASEAKSRFLAMMSHEIRTPLNGVTGMLHLLLRDRLTAQQQRWIDMAQNSAETLLCVINDILDFSKVEAGKLDLHLVPTDLHETVHQIATNFAERAGIKGLAWNLFIDPAVPRLVQTDADRLAQVLGNLLGNAVKFTDAGSVSLRVTRLVEDGTVASVRFAVIDTGMGVAPEQRDRLFKPFSQVDNSNTRRHGGTGLGLGISKQLVELLGGKIGVQSEAGKGSTFWFELPLQQTTVAPAPMVASATVATDVPSVGATGRLPEACNQRVLLVEDNEINQELAREMIRMAGCECECVPNGHEAVRAAASGRYALVFMDCMMPGMDGYGATRAIRAEEARQATPGATARRLPIIAMTANAMEGDREECLAAGMDDYLSKPLDPDQVARMLERWLAGVRQDLSPSGAGRETVAVNTLTATAAGGSL